MRWGGKRGPGNWEGPQGENLGFHQPRVALLREVAGVAWGGLGWPGVGRQAGNSGRSLEALF